MRPVKSWVEKTLAAVASRTEIPFAIRYADGTESRSRDAAPAFTLVFRTPRAYWRIAAFGHVGLLEAYFAGELDIEGSLPKALAAGMEGGIDGGAGLLVWLRNRGHELTHSNAVRSRARANAEAHYALPPEFYKFWLDDPLMLYTCAYWTEGTRSLEEALDLSRGSRSGLPSYFVFKIKNTGGWTASAAPSIHRSASALRPDCASLSPAAMRTRPYSLCTRALPGATRIAADHSDVSSFQSRFRPMVTRERRTSMIAAAANTAFRALSVDRSRAMRAPITRNNTPATTAITATKMTKGLKRPFLKSPPPMSYGPPPPPACNRCSCHRRGGSSRPCRTQTCSAR